MNRSNIPVMWRLQVAATVLTLCLAGQGLTEEITAFTEPYRDIDVAASELGTVAEILVKEGDRVSAGQVIGSLDSEVLRATLMMAETGVNSRGKLNSASAELRFQADRLEKLIALRDRQHASQQEVDRTKAQKEIADANLEAVQDELRLKGMERQRIEAEIRRRSLTSPIDGIVTVVAKDVGEFVSASDPVVVKVVQLNPLLVIFSASNNVASQLAVAGEVSLMVGDQETRVTGIVEFISPTADAQSSTVRVKIRVPNPEERIPCGATCRLLLAHSNSDGTDRVPLSPTATGLNHSRQVVDRRDH